MAGNSARASSFRGIAFANTRRKRRLEESAKQRRWEKEREIEETEERIKGGWQKREERREREREKKKER